MVALLLSALGLYGMLSSNVSQRTAEIGIRSALGASRGRILRMILSEAARLAAIGAILGAVGLFFSVRLIDGHALRGDIVRLAHDDGSRLHADGGRPVWPASGRRGEPLPSIRCKRCAPSRWRASGEPRDQAGT